MQDWIIDFMNQFGYLGITLLIALENIFPPIPSEVILTFGGFMTTYTDLQVFGVIIASTFGSLLGACVLYGVGNILSAERLGKILDGKIGQILHFNKEDVFKACDWFNSKGKNTVFICRCIPIVRSVISIPAGMAKMKFGLFFILTTAGSFIWNTVLVYLGVAASSSWEKIVAGTGLYTKITVIVLGVIAVVIAYLYLKKRLGK
ncbi:DedA family protein [Anaerocolumna sedimenticola]|uniref:DedA family protein n=1 Tax=Anaerocolumna sedimenticola TaxID=2696063 RepID=A0A6P1TPK8_9FIRM|nr:DedA family protein [Anaerocolumna sedimenticola]QHQ61736.1 DedA family protein [Anaerocolumna sedimenticola]